jgi:hypothetical protein
VAGPIQLDSLSNRLVAAGEHISGYGSGFADVAGVQVGSEWATDVRAAGGTVVSFTVPNGAGGASEWVIVHGQDGTTSPCVDDEQRITYRDPLESPAPGSDGRTPDTMRDTQDVGSPPAVLSVAPTSLPSSGGRLTIDGGGFQDVQWVHVGAADVTIESTRESVIVVRVGSLADFVGERLAVEVCNSYGQNYAIDNYDHITVTA